MANLTDVFNFRSNLTGADIKSLYEAEPNAFVDSDKSKIDSLYYIPTPTITTNYGAADKDEVRCDSSGGTFTITLPASGSVKIVDIVGVDADTGFGVNNLVVLPNAGQTVTGETSLELDVGATKIVFALFGTDWKIVDISAPQFVLTEWGEITNKPTYVDSTTIDFTETETEVTGEVKDGSIDESKLGINVNASLDLADSSVQLTGNQTITGQKTFTTALILPNNSRINGVEHFYQPGPTAPTVRGDSSALVAGDRWWKTDDGTEWFWNGTYWLSDAYYSIFKEYVSPNTKVYANNQYNLFQTAGTGIQFNTNYVLIEAVELYLQNTNESWFTGVLDGSNYFDTGLAGVNANKVTINSVDFFNNRNSRPRQLISSPITIPFQQSSETVAVLLAINGVVGNPSLSWTSGFSYSIMSKIRDIYF